MSTTEKDTPLPPPQTRSHGRGGAGNINSKPSSTVNANDLQTPTIKTPHYTTGRGGSGNMAKNNPDNPEESRMAQDVETPVHHGKEMQGTYHWGRGGEGNMTTLGKSGAQQARDASKDRKSKSKERALSKGESDSRRGSFREAVNKGKEMLGLKKGAPQDAKNESAIE